jgi:hypothetical protein
MSKVDALAVILVAEAPEGKGPELGSRAACPHAAGGERVGGAVASCMRSLRPARSRKQARTGPLCGHLPLGEWCPIRVRRPLRHDFE